MTHCARLTYGGILVGLIGLGSFPLLAQSNLLDTTVRVERKMTVQEIFDQLEAQPTVLLAYSESYVDVQQTVLFTSATLTLRDLLNHVSRITRTTYQVRGNQIIFGRSKRRYTVSGYVRGAQSGEDLIGATIGDVRSAAGTTSNTYGFYSLTLPADSIHLRCSYVGHTPWELTGRLMRDTVININLPDNAMLAEVTVMATGPPRRLVPEPTYELPIPFTQLRAIPSLLGEVDVLKSLQHVPGVQAGKDGGANFYVRGGSPDQNLILLDGVPVYNTSHLFGFFSVFNADAVNTTRFLKSGMPARYGGRLSSVTDISLKEGNRYGFHGAGGVGLLASHLMLEGPIGSPRTSFLVSARRTYPGVLSKPAEIVTDVYQLDRYHFYDLTAKVNHAFSQRDQVYFSTYLGQDRILPETLEISPPEVIPSGNDTLPDGYSSDLDFTEGGRWGNVTTALRWNHVYDHRLFSNLTLTHSRYRYEYQILEKRGWASAEGVTVRDYDFHRRSRLHDWAVQLDIDFSPSPQHHIRGGAGFTYHTFDPGNIRNTWVENEVVTLDRTYASPTLFATEVNGYLEDDVQLATYWQANVGVRWGGFWSDQQHYARWQPRLALRYQPGNTRWQVSYDRTTQFIHQLTNLAIALPSDLWVPTTDRIPPEMADQWALAYQPSVESAYTVQTEAYYKRMHNVLEYQGPLTLYEDDIRRLSDWQDQVVTGRGVSYGWEVLLKKPRGRFTGWAGYTWSRSRRQFDAIDRGAWFPFKYDRRHAVDLGGTFHWNDNIEVSWGWSCASGFAVTLPTAVYQEQPGRSYTDIVVYKSRNSERTRATHRLDVGIAFRKQTRWGERTWEFSVYNAYDRRNPFSVYVTQESKPFAPDKLRFWQTSLFSLVPSVNYRFKF